MPRIRPLYFEPLEHVFGWSEHLEPGQDVRLFTPAKRDSLWYPPRCVDMQLGNVGDVTFDADMKIVGVAASRADAAVDVIVGTARYLIFSGPWLLRGERIWPILVPDRQNLDIRLRPLPGGHGPVHVWVRCVFGSQG